MAQSSATTGLSGPTLRLFKAVELNDMAAVKASLDDGADLTTQNADGLTAPDVAVDMGHFIIAHYLLSRRLLGETEPVILDPGKAAGTGAQAVTARAGPKPPFSSPPGKPKPPPPVAAAKPEAMPEPPPSVAAAKPEAMPEPPESPEPAPAVPETAAAGKPKPAPEGPPKALADKTATPPAQGNLADLGVMEFFKSLVDLVTPGGEKPAGDVASSEPAGKQATPPPAAARSQEKPVSATTPAPGKDKEPEEIIVDLTGPAAATGEIIEEIKEIPPAKFDDKNLETIIAETDRKGAAVEAAAPTPADKTAMPAEKPAEKTVPKKEEKAGPSIVDRMADLFRADKKMDQPEAAPKDAQPPDPGGTPAEQIAKAEPAKAEPARAPAPAGAAGKAISSYDLPLPAPRPDTSKKFSPRFLDRLAEFMESGDEAAFKAWLPEMQVMPADAAARNGPPAAMPGPPGEDRPGADKIAAAAPPAAEKPATPVAPKPAATVAIVTGEPDISALDALEADLAGIAGEGPPTVVAAAPAGAPAPALLPATTEKSAGIKGVFNRLMGVIGPASGERDRTGRMVLEPEEKLATADHKAGAVVPSGDASKVWPVTEVEAAKTPPVAMTRRASDALLKTSMRGVTLSLGESVSLENSFPPAGDGTDPVNQCVKKNRGTTLFCIEPVDWPERLQADFLVPTILYTGHKVIARYDQGIASRLHALFPSDAFPRVITYFKDRYGDPTDSWNRSIAPFAKPRQDNPTLAWRSVDPKTGAISVLEIRKYDDTRGGFPDTSRGAVMLYLANSPPIFPQVSTHELMRLTRITMGAPGQQPAAEPADAGPGGQQPDLSLPEPGQQPDLSLPEPGQQPDLSLPEPGPESKPGAAAAPAPAAQPGAAEKTDKQLKDEARAKRRAEREAKRAAGAAKQAAGDAQQDIGSKRAPQAKAAPARPADESLDLPPEPKSRP